MYITMIEGTHTDNSARIKKCDEVDNEHYNYGMPTSMTLSITLWRLIYR